MRRIVCLAVLALFVTIFAGPGRGLAAEPGVTDSEVVLGLWSPFTGPTALLGT